ncbi:MAG: hypothetical protein JSS27_02710 [Planctomycetes bacterium]|nr:hypothetical protein [Planctomycetota bacterium]
MRGTTTPAGMRAADARCEFERDEPGDDDNGDDVDEREPSDEELAGEGEGVSEFNPDDDQLDDEPDRDDDFDLEPDDDWPCTDRLGAADEG